MKESNGLMLTVAGERDVIFHAEAKENITTINILKKFITDDERWIGSIRERLSLRNLIFLKFCKLFIEPVFTKYIDYQCLFKRALVKE